MRAPRRTGRRPPARPAGRARSCAAPAHGPRAPGDAEGEAREQQHGQTGKAEVVPEGDRQERQDDRTERGKRADHAALPDILERPAASPPEEDGDAYGGEQADQGLERGVRDGTSVAAQLDPLQGPHHEEHEEDAPSAEPRAGAQGAQPDGERVLLGRRSGHMCIARPRESRAASATASDIVGCAWMASSTSSTVYSFSRATASSATTTPSRNPLCASIGGPATSPIA